MAAYLFDTSALGKRYHPEVGTPAVERLLDEVGSRHYISRLTVTEIQSVFAGKVRMGVIGANDFELLRRRFLTELTRQEFQVVRMSGFHFQEAERLIRKYGSSQRLRTLDALQLAVALDLMKQGRLDHFVCADKGFIPVVVAEGLSVINPEQP